MDNSRWKKLLILGIAILSLILIVQYIEAESPFFSGNSTYHNKTLENDNSIPYIEGSNVSFQVNISDSDGNLVNATLELVGTNYTEATQDGLILWYKLNEGSGTFIQDSSRNGFNGTIFDPHTDMWRDGYFGKGFYNNGTAISDVCRYIGVDNPALEITGDISISFWFNFTGFSSSTTRNFAAHGESGETLATNILYAVNMNTTNSNDLGWFHESSSGVDQRITFDTNFSTGVWYHIVVTRNTSSQYVCAYVNGTLHLCKPYGVNAEGGTSGALRVTSGIPGACNPTDGTIDDFRIYNKVIDNTTVIKQLYEAGRGGGSSNVVYQIPNGTTWSLFFANISTPLPGKHNLKWYGTDSSNSQNSTELVLLDIIEGNQVSFLQDATYQGNTLENDNTFLYSSSNISFQMNITDELGKISNATFQFNGINYNEHVNNQNITSWLTFNDGVGNNATDRTGKRWAGVLQNGAVWHYGSNCTFGSCVFMDGGGGYIDVLNTYGGQINGSFTWSGWVKLGTGNTLQDRIVDMEDGGSVNGFSIFYNNNADIIFRVREGGTATAQINSGANNTDVWYFYAAVFNNVTQTASLYVNGTLVGEDTSAQYIPAAATHLRYGRRSTNTNNPTNMTLDDARIWLRALNASEVLALYQAKAGGGNISQVYQIPDGNRSSTFFINLSAQNPGIYNFNWIARDFSNNALSSTTFSLSVVELNPIQFTNNNTYQSGKLENDNKLIYSNTNISFDINITDDLGILSNATFEFNGTVYREYVSNINLTSWLTFNDGVGSIAIDRTGTNHSGELRGGAVYHRGGNCTFGSCVFMDGSTANVVVRNTNNTLNGSFTWTGWIKLGTGNEMNDRIVDMQDFGPENGFTLSYTSSLTTQFIVRRGDVITAQIAPVGTNQTDLWMYYTLTFNNQTQTARLYVNATLMGADTDTQMGPVSSWLRYGMRSINFNSPTNVSIDDARLYFRELNQSEILALYQASKGGGNLSQVYQIPNGNRSSTYFINLSSPNIGTHNFRWQAFTFSLNQEATPLVNLIILNITPIYTIRGIVYNTLAGKLLDSGTIVGIIKETGESSTSSINNGIYQFDIQTSLDPNTTRFTIGMIMKDSSNRDYTQLLVGTGGLASHSRQCAFKTWRFKGFATDASGELVPSGRIGMDIDGQRYSNSTIFSNGQWDITIRPCLISGEVYKFNFVAANDANTLRTQFSVNQVAE